MELSTMLEYQKLDIDLMSLENKLRQSQAAKEYTANKATLTNAQEQVLKQNRDAGEMTAQMESLIAEYEAIEKELKEAEGAVPDVDNAVAADFFVRNVQKLVTRLKVLASEISKMSSKIVELNQSYAAVMTAGKEAKKKLVAAPEKGYQKEIAADFGEKPETFYLLAFLKNGDHYGKVILGPGSIRTGKDKIQLVKMGIWVIFNRQEGERNVNFE